MLLIIMTWCQLGHQVSLLAAWWCIRVLLLTSGCSLFGHLILWPLLEEDLHPIGSDTSSCLFKHFSFHRKNECMHGTNLQSLTGLLVSSGKLPWMTKVVNLWTRKPSSLTRDSAFWSKAYRLWYHWLHAAEDVVRAGEYRLPWELELVSPFTPIGQGQVLGGLFAFGFCPVTGLSFWYRCLTMTILAQFNDCHCCNDARSLVQKKRYVTLCQVLNLWSATYTWCSVSCACHFSLLLACCLFLCLIVCCFKANVRCATCSQITSALRG